MSLPTELDFAANREATPERMNLAMAYLIARLRAVEALKPDIEAAIATFTGVGLDRLAEALTPLVVQAQQDAAALAALLADWTEEDPFEDFYTKIASDARFAPLLHGHDVADITGLAGALASYAPLASPALTGTPTAPTAAGATNTTQIASTAFVQAALAALVASSPAALDTLNEFAAALGNDPNFATTITNALAGKAPLASPALTGTPTAPTAPAATNTTQLATTAFVQAALAAYPKDMELVGYAVPVKGASAGGTITPGIALTGLTGGVDTQARTGDTVVLVSICGSNGGALTATATTAGFSKAFDITAANGATGVGSFAAFTKYMSGSPDATAVVSIPGTTSNSGYVLLAVVLRGGSPTTPIDVVAATSTSGGSLLVNPPSNAPATSRNLVLALGGGAHRNGNGNYTVTGSGSSSVDSFNASTNDVMGGIGIVGKNVVAAFDPAAWTSAVADSGVPSHCAATLILRGA